MRAGVGVLKKPVRPKIGDNFSRVAASVPDTSSLRTKQNQIMSAKFCVAIKKRKLQDLMANLEQIMKLELTSDMVNTFYAPQERSTPR